MLRIGRSQILARRSMSSVCSDVATLLVLPHDIRPQEPRAKCVHVIPHFILNYPESGLTTETTQ